MYRERLIDETVTVMSEQDMHFIIRTMAKAREMIMETSLPVGWDTRLGNLDAAISRLQAIMLLEPKRKSKCK